MSPENLLLSASLLGIYALLGGIYAVMYAVGCLRRRAAFLNAGRAAYAAQLVVLLALLGWSALAPPWKVFLLVSSAAYLIVPPVTLRYLERLHDAVEVPR